MCGFPLFIANLLHFYVGYLHTLLTYFTNSHTYLPTSLLYYFAYLRIHQLNHFTYLIIYLAAYLQTYSPTYFTQLRTYLLNLLSSLTYLLTLLT